MDGGPGCLNLCGIRARPGAGRPDQANSPAGPGGLSRERGVGREAAAGGTVNLETRVALVTGSSRGLGRALALKLAQRGASVVVNYAQNREQAECVVASIRESGGKAVAAGADVSVSAEAESLVGAALSN